MIGKLTAIARPYALAAFESALEKSDLAAWEIMLRDAALIANNPAVSELFSRPEITREQLRDLFCEVLASILDTEKKNFLWLLADKGRLPALADIAELFADYRAEHEKSMTVKVVSAVTLDEHYKNKLMNALTKRLQRKVSLQCDVDPALLAGAVIYAGDTVIDGSVRGKLNRLIESL